jgi:hypothetical protein
MSNIKTGKPSRDRTYWAFDENGRRIGADITERVLESSGGLSSFTMDPDSHSSGGVFQDQMGLGPYVSGAATLYQYFLTSVPGTPWVSVPTPVRTASGQYMVSSVTLSAINGIYDVSYNGDAGMWNANGSPRLPLCDH